MNTLGVNFAEIFSVNWRQSKSMGKGSKKNSKPGHVSVAQAVRDVLLRAMSTGQLVPLTIAGIIIIFLLRLEPSDLAVLVNRILDALIDYSIAGYVLALIIALAWAWHASVMRKCFSAEVARISREKTKHQQEKTSHSLGTSDK